jgi:4-amino-4-deoxy-L-arabinose transferase-like glycosyltransferase
VTRSRFGLDSASLTAIGLAITLALANGVWILLDHSDPSWDQAHYLYTALQYKNAFHGGDLTGLLRAVNDIDPSHGPFFTLALVPPLAIFDVSNRSGLLVNLVAAPILYLAAGEIAYTIFRNNLARLLAIFLVATTPILVGLFHNVLQDFLLVTLTTLSLLLLLKSDGFRRRWITWGMALTMALGTLTKVTFPLFVIGPLLVVVAEVVYEAASASRGTSNSERSLRPALLNVGGALLVYLVVAMAWYGPNFSATLDYVRSTTGGPLSLGAGPSDPYTFHAIASFTAGVINENLSWVILLVGVVGVLLCWRRLRSLFRRPLDLAPLWKLAFLLSWALVPYLSVALAHNQDVRLMAPAFPAVAVLAAGAVSSIPKAQARLAVATIAVVVLGYQTLTHITDVTPGFLPNRLSVSASSYQAEIPLDSEPIGYERLPGDEYVEPIFDYIETVSSRETGGSSAAKTICLLQSDPVVNSNTFGFMSAARGAPYGFADVVEGQGGAAELREVLSGCNFALYSRPPQPPPSDAYDRLTLVNEPYAANHMTPAMFRLFQGPSRIFPVAPQPDQGDVGADQGTAVRVLTRTPYRPASSNP